MDVKDLNVRDRGPNKKFKKSITNGRITHFSIETYFIWFSLLIYATELIVDLSLATYYLHKNQIEWGITTLSITILPIIVCQIYSVCLLRADNNVQATALVFHLFLMGIPYRYHSILRKLEKDKTSTNLHDIAIIKQRIRDVNAIQTLNAILQYCPQSLFQVFLIVYRRYKCVVTGVSAGLAGFSFLWHVFLHFYFWLDRNDDRSPYDQSNINSNTRIIDNLSSSLNDGIVGRSSGTNGSGVINRNSIESASAISNNTIGNRPPMVTTENIATNLKNFEKSSYNSHDKNLIKKGGISKNVEKSKIFGLNKRRPIYEKEDFDVCETSNISTVFFEVDDSVDSNRFYSSLSSSTKDMDNFINENNFNLVKTYDYKYKPDLRKTNFSDREEDDPKQNAAGAGATKKTNAISENRNNVLKRKGICSSQEMLHLVDILNDNISPEQVDVLAKSLIEMGGDESLRTESEHEDLDNLKLLEQFPSIIDDKLLENIDAAIYENQIIFQERIRKNQLTIQNLKLQDQMLSKCMSDPKAMPSEILSIRDYENMCFTNISRPNGSGIKHWRNYLTDIDTNNHDNSTVQHSSFYVNTNTLSNSLTDLYINETELGSTLIDAECNGGKNPNAHLRKPAVAWHHKSNVNEICCVDDDDDDDDDRLSDDLYVNLQRRTNDSSGGGDGAGGVDEACALPEKNILVETINKINVDSPLKNLLLSKSHKTYTTASSSIMDPSLHEYFDDKN